MKIIRETTAFFNKQYSDASDGSFLKAIQVAFIKKIVETLGKIPEHVHYADDCFVVYRNLGFLSDPTFCKACRESELDGVLFGRIWRIYVLAWSLSQRWRAGGVYIDCGTYNGKALEVALRYAKYKSESRLGPRAEENLIIAADLFENPPDEARKKDHGPNLSEEVRVRLNKIHETKVCKGYLPDSLTDLQISTPVQWVQIDLNSEVADLSTFRYLIKYLAENAIVVFDDYGFSRYSQTQQDLNAYVEENALNPILELPTGQGLYIHTRESGQSGLLEPQKRSVL